MTQVPETDLTHAELRSKYADADAASRYGALHGGRRRHRREERCIASALSGLAPGSRVLDLPCGTGRMFPLLTSLGFEVVGGDLSAPMIERAHGEAGACNARGIDVLRVDVFETGFEDGEFDAVLCNRFLHHLGDAERRVVALRELARVSRGPLVASYFSSRSWDALRTGWKRRRRRQRSDRASLDPESFLRDLADAGLRAVRVHRALPWISQQWYVAATSL